MFKKRFLFVCFFISFLSEATTLNFCYESKELFPHYIGEGVHVPDKKPGAAIEMLQHLDSNFHNVQIRFVREPWNRCLNDLKLGKVDALIARYSEGRVKFAKYPKQNNGAIDTSRSFSNTSTCFIHSNNVLLEWDGQELKTKQRQGIAVPRGYSLVEDLKSKGFQIYETTSVKKAHELLFNGRVGVSLSDCNHKKLPVGFVENKTPIVENYGYLVFSHQFYDFYPSLSERMWDKLIQIDHKLFYEKY